jgi:hypothetical protein
MDSLRKIWLCDLLCERRGYVQVGLNSNIIGLILQKYVHKDQTPQNPNARKRTKQKRGGRNPVGDNNGQSGQPIAIGGKRVCFMWRHRIFECCGTSMIGISLFMRLFFDSETSFLEPELPPQPPHNNNNNNGGRGVFEQPRRPVRRNRKNVSKKRELNANPELTSHQYLTNYFKQNNNELEEHNPLCTRNRPNWQELMLLHSWSGETNISAPDTVYRRVLKSVGVEFNHLTHLRSSGLEQASTWGLDCFRLATMSKHLLDKINRFYMAESNREVLTMMSGFVEEGDTSYVVPRTQVEIPYLLNDEYVSHIFPNYCTWVAESQSRNGDKNKLAAKNFLFGVLPCLARIVIQDAPYHLEKYPSSEFSRFFRAQVYVKYPAYAEYCRSAIKKADEFATARRERATKDLNSAAQ